MSVDWTRPIQTRDGKMKGDYYGAVDIYHVVRLVGNGKEMVVVRLIDGLDPVAFGETPLDIVNVPQPVTVEIQPVYMNVWKCSDGKYRLGGVCHTSIESARQFSNSVDELACIWKVPTTIEGMPKP